jgi:urease accessory protein
VQRDGCTALEGLRGEAPFGLFPGPGPAPGWARVWLVGSAGGPLGGDDLELRIEVSEGAALAIGSVAATIALSGASRLAVHAVVEPGASLVWSPEPVVVTKGADFRVDLQLDVSCPAHLHWRDELVLGRAGEEPGRCVVRQCAELGATPWVRHELAVGGPGWDGGAVVGAYRAIGSVLTTAFLERAVGGPAAHLHPEAGGTLTVALAADRPALDALLPVPQFPALQRSLHAASRVDA